VRTSKSTYRVIQSPITILKDVGDIIWSIKCKEVFYRFITVLELRSFDVVVAFIIVTIEFYRVEKIVLT